MDNPRIIRKDGPKREDIVIVLPVYSASNICPYIGIKAI